MHFSLLDATITKFKPLLNAQLEQQDTLATFTSQLPADEEANTLAAYKFDYGMKQNSNFIYEHFIWDDQMLMAGHGIMSVNWDADKKRKEFKAIDPEYIIVPTTAGLVQDLDFLVEVEKHSRESFERNPLFSDEWKKDEMMDRLQGKWPKPGENQTTNWKEQREGITTQIDESNSLIIWKVWHRDPDTFAWLKSYTNPSVFGQSLAALGTILNPYAFWVDMNGVKLPGKGDKDNGDQYIDLLPYVKQNFEMKDDRWYSSRGVCEMGAPYEDAMCGLWNSLMEAIILTCRPFLQAKNAGQQIPNGTNLMLNPGSILAIPLEKIGRAHV